MIDPSRSTRRRRHCANLIEDRPFGKVTLKVGAYPINGRP